MNVYRSALSIGVMSGVPNVSDFTWPRDRGLPPPITQPQSTNPSNLEQAMQTLRQSDEARERQQQAARQQSAEQREAPAPEPAPEAEAEAAEEDQVNKIFF